MNTTVHDAVIVGGGHNGLVCAAYLAKAGLDVLVLERNHLPGGACVTEELFPGYFCSTYSYGVYTLQDRIVRDLNLYQHGYKVAQLDVRHFHPFPNGKALRIWEDNDRTCREITETFSERDAIGYRAWQDFWRRAGGLLSPYALIEPPTVAELVDQMRGTENETLLARLLTGTVTDLLDEVFETEEVKASVIPHILDIQGLDAPGSLFTNAMMRVNRVLDAQNQGLAIGGMGTLSLAMARAAQSFGAMVRCGAEVKRILIEDGRAQGVELTDGQAIRGQVVISNADPKRTFLGLVGEAHLTTGVATTIRNLDTKFATLKFHAAVSEIPDFSRYLGQDADLRHLVNINLCPSTDYYRHSLQDAMAGRPTRYPIIDVQIPTACDRSVAPEGKHIVSMWVRYAPVTPREGTWDELRRQVGLQLIDAVTEYAPNFRQSILDWLLYTPADLERRLYMTDGNFRHTDHTPSQLLGDRLFSRGGHRTPVSGLYMCGVGTHPGGDVSGAPGHNAAQAVLVDYHAKT